MCLQITIAYMSVFNLPFVYVSVFNLPIIYECVFNLPVVSFRAASTGLLSVTVSSTGLLSINVSSTGLLFINVSSSCIRVFARTIYFRDVVSERNDKNTMNTSKLLTKIVWKWLMREEHYTQL